MLQSASPLHFDMDTATLITLFFLGWILFVVSSDDIGPDQMKVSEFPPATGYLLLGYITPKQLNISFPDMTVAEMFTVHMANTHRYNFEFLQEQCSGHQLGKLWYYMNLLFVTDAGYNCFNQSFLSMSEEFCYDPDERSRALDLLKRVNESIPLKRKRYNVGQITGYERGFKVGLKAAREMAGEIEYSEHCRSPSRSVGPDETQEFDALQGSNQTDFGNIDEINEEVAAAAADYLETLTWNPDDEHEHEHEYEYEYEYE